MKETNGDAAKAHRVGRRRLLGGVGASGLAAAVAVFGRSSPAFAGNYGCCNLYVSPPNISYATCTTSSTTLSYYNWSCSSGGYSCQCCEQYVYGVYFTGSGARC
jgi:hypothetical protein